MRIRDVMVRQVKTCLPQDDLNRVAQILWENDCGWVPVATLEGELVGVLTDRDICMAAYTQGLPLSSIRVENVMSREVYTCSPEDAVSSAQAAMARCQVRRLPVVDSRGKLVGILALGDLARAAVRLRPGSTRGLFMDAVAATLAAICHPRTIPETLPGPLPREIQPRADPRDRLLVVRQTDAAG